MQIVVLTLTFSLPGCRSLKEKRQRMGGIHERYGRNLRWPFVKVVIVNDWMQANGLSLWLAPRHRNWTRCVARLKTGFNVQSRPG
ncbi:Protein of unknown function [Halopseudomonas bauzanensis]|uniref:Uncharacterized protein n=1 Tax=Halopseudomonas bauzanensis TaxID=653930 RepID=A0A1I4PVU5_9GAMM|nr:Protein of unknown function [Halopseudomonas bauzanensis]SFM31962.1 Protein of unknown function [Halopseudomonas bauzanensis]